MRTRREAIENLEYLISGECCDSHMDYIEEIEMAITDMKICDANNAGWISVKDRLPEKKGYYLIFNTDRTVWPYWYDPFVNQWVDSLGFRTESVTHWIPMPEPPKEADNE